MNGAFWFGAVVGWFLYFTNRYRKEDVKLADVAGLLAAIGGGAVTSLFGKGDGTRADLFLSYGAGLGAGFFGYFIVLIAFITLSRGDYNLTSLIDGRRRRIPEGWEIPEGTQGPVRNFVIDPRGVSTGGPVARMIQPAAVDRTGLDTQRQALAEAIDGTRLSILRQFNAAADATVQGHLDDVMKQLDVQRDRLDTAAIRADLPAPEVQRAVAKLAGIAQGVNAEAQNMRDAASTLSAVAKVVALVGQAVGIIAMLA